MPNVGRNAPDGTHTQSVVFTKADWKMSDARKWLKEHDYYMDGLDETENSYRFRQYDPDDNKFRYRAKPMATGITLIIGYLKEKKDMVNNKQYTTATIEAKSIDDATRTLVGIASTGDVDRQGEVIDVNGWDIKNYLKNSVILLSHDYSQPPIGKAQWVKRTSEGLKFKAEFAKTPVADEVYQLYRDGFMKGFSVGFAPVEWKDGDGKKEPSRTYTKTELLEISAVSVPANADALVLALDEGRIKTKALQDIAQGLKSARIEVKPEPEIKPAEIVKFEIPEETSSKTAPSELEDLQGVVAELWEANAGLTDQVMRLTKRCKSIDEFISETILPILMTKQSEPVDFSSLIDEAMDRAISRKTGKVK